MSAVAISAAGALPVGGKLTSGKFLVGVGVMVGGVLLAGFVMAKLRKKSELIGYAHSGYDSFL